MKISNISCFIDYEIDKAAKELRLKIFTRLRPKHVEKTIKIEEVEKFDLDYELSMLKLETRAPWNGTMQPDELKPESINVSQSLKSGFRNLAFAGTDKSVLSQLKPKEINSPKEEKV